MGYDALKHPGAYLFLVLIFLFFSGLWPLVPGRWFLAFSQEPTAPALQQPAPPPSPPLSQDPFQRGQELLGRGDLEAAQQAFQEAIQKAPDQPEPQYFLGVIYLEQGEAEKAIRQFEKVLKIVPNHLLSYHNLGLAHVRLGQKEEAIGFFQKAVAIQPAFYPAYLELGLIYESQERVEEAVTAFQAAIQYGGVVPQAQEVVKRAQERLAQVGDTREKALRASDLFKQGQEALKNNQLKDAQARFEEILGIIPQNAVARYMLAKVALETGNIYLATRLLEAAVKIDLNAWQIYYLLGQIYESQGRWSEAVLVYLVVARIITEGPINQDVRQRLATLKAVIEEQTLKEAIQKGAPLAEARRKFEQGITMLQQGNTENAVSLIQEAIKLDPNNPFYYYNLGIAYFGETRLIEATSAIQKSIELRATYGPAHFFLGQIYVASGDAARDAGELIGAAQEYRKAIAELDQTLRLGAEGWQLEQANEKKAELEDLVGKVQEAHGHIILATVLDEKKRKKKALKEFKKASDLIPQDPFSRLSIGVIYEERGEIEKAIQVYEEAAKFSPLNPNPHVYLGQLYENQKKVEEAIKAYQTAIERSPRFPVPVIRLGTLYFNQDRLEEAKAEFLKAIQLDPKQAEPHFFLGQIYEKEGEEGKAIQEYQTAQVLVPPGLEIGTYIQDRLAFLDRFSGSWSHSFLTYDSNVNVVKTNPTGDYTSSFSVAFSYIPFRSSRLHRLLPVPLAVPVDISTSASTRLHGLGTLSTTESLAVSLQTSLMAAYSLSSRYSLSYSQSDRKPIAINHAWSLSLARFGQIPSQVGVSISILSVLGQLDASDDRLIQSLGFSTSQSINYWGSFNFSYGYSEDKSPRPDQPGNTHSFTFGYSRLFFRKLSLSTSLNYAVTRFDTPRFLSSPSGQTLTFQTAEASNFRVSGSVPLPNGVSFSVSYQRVMNQTNIEIPVGVTPEEQEILHRRALGTYNRDLLSFSLSTSF